jgi:DNA-binding HxlR family transcriptional regulator
MAHEPVPALCPRFHKAVELIGKRWTGAILRVLQGGRTRFNAIAHAIPEMSDRMLAERLRELEHEAIVLRHVIPETPVRVEYELSDKGRALDEAFCAIARWAEQWGDVVVAAAPSPGGDPHHGHAERSPLEPSASATA